MSKHYAIRCTNCNAPLDIIGGAKVNTVTCKYCHSILDLNQDYQVLGKFNDIDKPDTILSVGMSGVIDQIAWTIIGQITYKEIDFPADEWSEFLIYSPIYGYAWLIEEQNKFYFSYRVRDFDLLSWQKEKPKTIFYKKMHYIRHDESYEAYVYYVQGELTSIVKHGDRYKMWDYNGVNKQELNIETNNNETEVYSTKELKQSEIYNSFGLQDSIKIEKTKKPIKQQHIFDDDNPKAYRFGWVILFGILLITILLSMFTPKDVTLFYTNKGTSKHIFDIDSDAFVTEITIDSRTRKLANTSVTIYKDKKKIFYIDNSNIYYTKKALYHNWSSDALKADIYLHLDKGNYSIEIQQSDNNSRFVTIKERVIRLKYISFIFLIVSFILLYQYIELLESQIFKRILVIAFLGSGLLLVWFNFTSFVIIAIILYFERKGKSSD